LPDADVGMFGAESNPLRSAPIAFVVSSALCGQAASRQAHADVTRPTPVDRAERANKWKVIRRPFPVLGLMRKGRQASCLATIPPIIEHTAPTAR